MMWHRRETRRQTEKTKFNLNIRRNLPTRPRQAPSTALTNSWNRRIAGPAPSDRFHLSPAGIPISCRALVALNAFVSSRGSVGSRAMNCAWAGFDTVIGNQSSAAAAARYL
jgi:hypothetical protein